MEMLRFITAGSVDDGKSTLIGRLLYDSKSLLQDQVAALERSRARGSDGQINLALLTDGLRAEREQGITIDVAYKYFTTPRRKFIIADTPGHVQYTRNMVTGASTADLAILLVDAAQGIAEQTRRHAYLAALLRIPHLVLAVNKMDAVDFDDVVYERIRAEFAALTEKSGFASVTAIPISALQVTTWWKNRSARLGMPVRRCFACWKKSKRIAGPRPCPRGWRFSSSSFATTAAPRTIEVTLARSCPAYSNRATPSWCCRRAGPAPSLASIAMASRWTWPTRPCR